MSPLLLSGDVRRINRWYWFRARFRVLSGKSPTDLQYSFWTKVWSGRPFVDECVRLLYRAGEVSETRTDWWFPFLRLFFRYLFRSPLLSKS